MIIYLIIMYINYIIGKILTMIYKKNYMEQYEKMKKDLIEYLIK